VGRAGTVLNLFGEKAAGAETDTLSLTRISHERFVFVYKNNKNRLKILLLSC
jgi:hypothetical protein